MNHNYQILSVCSGKKIYKYYKSRNIQIVQILTHKQTILTDREESKEHPTFFGDGAREKAARELSSQESSIQIFLSFCDTKDEFLLRNGAQF